MGFNRKLKYYLVHRLGYTNKEAQGLIDAGVVEIDAQPVTENCLFPEEAEVRVKGEVVKPRLTFVYLKFYKPVGFESTLNPNIKDSLSGFFTIPGLAIAGRLDKASEGLLLLSNDGKWVEQLCNPKFEKEKEYLVTLDRTPDATFVKAFSAGVDIGDHFTAPCSCIHLDDPLIKVILKEGKNRQIRRMCKALGYQVIALKRIRIDQFLLDKLAPGEMQDAI